MFMVFRLELETETCSGLERNRKGGNAAKCSIVERWFSMNANCFGKHICTRLSRLL
jgi:hypothetical protein